MRTIKLTDKQAEVLIGLLRVTCNNTEDQDAKIYEAILQKLSERWPHL